jgi:YD repeat-containing protein
MNRILALAWLALVTFSCTKEDLVTPQPQPTLLPHRLVQGDMALEIAYSPEGKISQLTTTNGYPGGTLIHDQFFLYDDAGKLAEVTTSSGWRFVYTYSGGRIVETLEYLDGNLSQKHQFAYDSKGRVSQSITYQDIPEEGGWIPVQKSTYSYNNTGNLLENRLYYFGTGGTPEYLLTVNTFSDYDQKINTEASFEITVINPQLKPFVNNPGKLEIRNGNGHLSVTETYTYTYNAEGYAESKTTTSLFNGNTEVYTTSYFFLEPDGF